MENMDVFADVVEQQSLNRAAQLLNISQPALSRKIMNLEESLGVRLFERKGKRLELTRAGQICYEYAIQMRQLNREFIQAMNRFKIGELPASLTIGASLTTLQSTLPDLISFYTGGSPNTDIKALTGKTHEIVSLVKDHKVDIGLVASHIEQPGLHCDSLFDDHLCLVLPALHELSSAASVGMRELDHLPMILFSKGTWYRIMMDEIFHRHNVFPNVKMEIDSFEAILRLVSTMGTATLLPMSYLRSRLLENNDLCIRQLPELIQTKRTTSLVYTDEAARDGAIRFFVEKAKEYFARTDAG
ncbi:LysR family transcriptional regulator [Paenibacillus sp. CC-CFT747]|nr:LysR family transcriptional regulator [Paenibacillus sp. CC-CFT747]